MTFTQANIHTVQFRHIQNNPKIDHLFEPMYDFSLSITQAGYGPSELGLSAGQCNVFDNTPLNYQCAEELVKEREKSMSEVSFLPL